MNQDIRYDVIIIGGGSMGSATAYQIAKRGKKVLLLEQFHFVHDKGAHSGESRLIRKAYFEHEDYVPLLLRAYDNWAQLEKECKEQLYFETGIVYFGKKDDGSIPSIKHSAQKYNLPLEELSTSEAKQRFPVFSNIPDDWSCIIEKEAGYLLVEKSVKQILAQASFHGATLKDNEKVLSWKASNDRVEVFTELGTYHAEKLVITAGAWTQKILGDLDISLKVTRQTLGWIKPFQLEALSKDKFICWCIFDEQDGLYYGMPLIEMNGVQTFKLGCHSHGQLVEADKVDRSISQGDIDSFWNCIDRYMPTAKGELKDVSTCLYTNSIDENFIIDIHPRHSNVSFACGFSGHGFKFASVIGEIMADLAMKGKTELPIEFLGLGRFKK